MKYMLLIYHDENTWSSHTEAERQQIYLEYRQLIERLKEEGKYLFGDQLQASAAGSTVQVRDRKTLLTDGPFAETREQIGGFFMIEAADLDEARTIAAQIPSARQGTIEIRPVVPATEAAGA